ncbi:TonB-dependent receptor [Rhizorhapis sp.]|uniref:TonB-dependent receptor n=1 Tax=Rhizorhapis sp. TaxID=1968842 RepID=UPI002B469371|nr:TonB-dependent receptor [Rhizorhapis sp.]HKR17860.1 TonB-dependent receptor [Rhizorhapis sp.]
MPAKLYSRLLTTVAASTLATSTLAQEVAHTAQPQAVIESGGMEDIVVTAEKRESSVQKTPLSITALDSAALSSRGIVDINQVSGLVPSMAINNYAGTPRITIRGLGLTAFAPGFDGAVAVHVNGVYLAHVVEAGAQFLDMERVEVLRGPQGTLYGRNATGGSVNLITKRPTSTFEAGLEVNVGNYSYRAAEGFVSGPVNDRIRARFAIRGERRDGFSLNLFDGKRYDDLAQFGFRGSLEFDVAERLQLALSGDYFYGNDHQYATHFLGNGRQGRFVGQPSLYNQELPAVLAGGQTIPRNSINESINPRLLNTDRPPDSMRRYYGFSGTLDWELNDNVSLKSITSYRHIYYLAQTERDATNVYFANFNQSERARQFSEELQLLGDTESLKWIVGAYYLNDRILNGYQEIDFGPAAGATNVTPPDRPEIFMGGSASTKAYAIFAQATYSLTHALSITPGIRYSEEKRSIDERLLRPNPVVAATNIDSASFHAVTPKLVLQYEPTSRLMAYASVSKGFKSGGYAVTGLQGEVQPEKLWAYEIGIKSKLFNNHFQTNISAFHYDYTNLQVSKIVNNRAVLENAADATVDGIELELRLLPIQNLVISGSFAYNDAKFKNFATVDPAFPELLSQDLSGKRLPDSSKYTFSVAPAYTIPLGDEDKIVVSGEYNWRSTRYFTPFNLKNAYQPAFGMLNARIRYAGSGGSWYAELWGKNLTNKLAVIGSFVSGPAFGFPRNGQLEDPRTYGIRVGFKL